jgi:hypothetical protein
MLCDIDGLIEGDSLCEKLGDIEALTEGDVD